MFVKYFNHFINRKLWKMKYLDQIAVEMPSKPYWMGTENEIYRLAGTN